MNHPSRSFVRTTRRWSTVNLNNTTATSTTSHCYSVSLIVASTVSCSLFLLLHCFPLFKSIIPNILIVVSLSFIGLPHHLCQIQKPQSQQEHTSNKSPLFHKFDCCISCVLLIVFVVASFSFVFYRITTPSASNPTTNITTKTHQQQVTAIL